MADQFEIIGNSDNGEQMAEIGVRQLGRDFIEAYRAGGGTGHYSPGMRMLGLSEPKHRIVFKRILVRRKLALDPDLGVWTATRMTITTTIGDPQ